MASTRLATSVKSCLGPAAASHASLRKGYARNIVASAVGGVGKVWLRRGTLGLLVASTIYLASTPGANADADLEIITSSSGLKYADLRIGDGNVPVKVT